MVEVARLPIKLGPPPSRASFPTHARDVGLRGFLPNLGHRRKASSTFRVMYSSQMRDEDDEVKYDLVWEGVILDQTYFIK